MSQRFRHAFDLASDDYGRPDWHQNANCRGMGADLFFAPHVAPQTLAVCEGCPVIVECGATGQHEMFGVWAGRPVHVPMRRPRKAPKTSTRPLEDRRVGRKSGAACGTNAAYYAHLRWGEDPCEPCLEAHARYVKAGRPSRARAS